jgi:hypothetical protein
MLTRADDQTRPRLITGSHVALQGTAQQCVAVSKPFQETAPASVEFIARKKLFRVTLPRGLFAAVIKRWLPGNR